MLLLPSVLGGLPLSDLKSGASPGRKSVLSRLNVLFCLLVVLIHVLSQPVTVLDHSSWQYALVLITQRLSLAAVYGFFVLSGVKLMLPRRRPVSLGKYYLGRIRRLVLPYLLAAFLYYLYFVHVLHYFPFSLTDFLGYLKWGDLSGQFYFLYPLFQLVLLSPLIRYIVQRQSPLLVIPVSLFVTWLSSEHLNDLLATFSPGLTFGHSDILFTTYLVYYVVGCYIGLYWDSFESFLKENRALITGLFVVFASADGLGSWLLFSGRREVVWLNFTHVMYSLVCVLFLFLVVPKGGQPSGAVQKLDRASYLIYLYHCLAVTAFNAEEHLLPVTDEGILLLLRAVFVYTVTLGGCILWQALWARIRSAVRNFRN